MRKEIFSTSLFAGHVQAAPARKRTPLPMRIGFVEEKFSCVRTVAMLIRVACA
jgi:hypothetical protein